MCVLLEFFSLVADYSKRLFLLNYRINGYPGKYVRIAGEYRLEEVCQDSIIYITFIIKKAYLAIFMHLSDNFSQSDSNLQI